MSMNTLRGRSLPGLGAYCLGLGIIVAATILNLAHDRLSEGDIARLPFGLPRLYDSTGKFGVTLLLTALGLSIITLGAMVRRTRVEGPREGQHVPRTPTFYGPGDDAPGEAHAQGAIVLTTRRYLAHANLSGTTGFPTRRVPQG